MKTDTRKTAGTRSPGKQAGAFTADHGNLFEELFNLSPTPYFLLNPHGEIVDLNPSGARLLGREKSQLISKQLITFISNETQPILVDFLKLVFNTDTKFGCQVTLSGENTLKTVLQFEGLVSKERQICFLTAVDITERKQLEENFNHERMLLRTLIDNLPDTLYIKDAQGRKIIANPADVDVMGYHSEAEVIGKTDLEIFNNETGQRGYADDQTVLQSGQPILEREEDFFDASGKQRWLLTSKIPLYDEPGKIIGLVGIGRDITARRQAEAQLARQTEQLKELNATKDKFFSIIAHDLRSPFGTIMGLVELLISDIKDFDKEEIERFLGMIANSSKQAFNLLENLLLWARNQRGTMSFQPEIMEIQKRVLENINLVQGQADKKEIRITSQIRRHQIVMADKNMLDTILRNLFSNAIKFTPDNGEIVIMAKTKDKMVEISVCDNGVGITREDIDTIFKTGGKPSAFGTAGERGSGLGLILCKEFVEKNQGKIWVESKPGKGSTFSFTIPMAF
ncbi:MAG: PAS domain-containing sensor histidine kinase [Bacteroidota bacterium]